MTLKIFLSYAREDELVADGVRRALSEWGYAPWMDVYDIPKGAYWPDEIDRALNEADLVVGVLSPRSVASRNVKNEWDWCIVYGRRLLLLQCEPGYVPVNYVSLNRINCAGPRFDTGLSELREVLARGRTFPASDGDDPYQEYLRALYERVNRFLAQKIVPSLTSDESDPQPLRLSVRAEVNAVDSLFARRNENEVDPLFVVAGLEPGTDKGVFQDIWEAFDYHGRRLLLLGSPGSGKTFTLLHACRDAVVRRMRDKSAPLPIFSIISTWNLTARPPLEDWLEASYGAPADVRRLLAEGRALLLLDGLDEIRSESQGLDPRADFLDRLPLNNEVLITCRELDYKQLGHKAKLGGAVTLMPLTDDQIRQMVVHQPRLAAMIESDASLKESLRTPLLLGLFATVSGGYGDDLPHAFLQGATGLPEIRDRVLKAYLEKRHKHEVSKLTLQTPPPLSVYSLDEVYEVFGYACMLASGVTSGERYGETAIPTHMIATAYQYAVLSKKGTWSSEEGLRVREEARHFIAFALKLNLLVEIGLMFDEPLYVPIHKLFFDHFAFVYALKHVADGRLYRDIMSNKPTTVLARLGDRRAVAPLIEALKSDNLYMRFSAAEALGVLGDVAAAEPLIMALKDPNAYVRISAAEALGKLGDTRAVEPLASRLADWEEGYFRLVCNAAADALKQIGTPEALAAVSEAQLNGLLKDDPPFEW